jgi:hypothetical protein
MTLNIPSITAVSFTVRLIYSSAVFPVQIPKYKHQHSEHFTMAQRDDENCVALIAGR